MPTKAKAAKTTKQRTQVKDLPQPAEELTAKQAKQVKGGLLTANPEEEPAAEYGGAPVTYTTPNDLGQRIGATTVTDHSQSVGTPGDSDLGSRIGGG